MKHFPLVSAIVPTFNSSSTILRALDSIAAQNYPEIELIVVDDCSHDDTCEKVRGFDKLPIRLICLPQNGGAAAARNAGIVEASGKYIAFLDSDDAWRKEKLRKQVAVAELDQRIGLVTCDCIVLDSQGNEVKRLHQQNSPYSGPEVWKRLLANNFIPTPSALLRRDLLLRERGFDTQLHIAEDLDLWIRLAAVSEVAVVPDVLVEVHDQPNSLHKRYSGDEEASTIRVVETNLARQRGRLTGEEIRRIRGERYFKLGANFYHARMYGPSASAFLRAIRFGFRPLKSAINVQRAVCKRALVGLIRVEV